MRLQEDDETESDEFPPLGCSVLTDEELVAKAMTAKNGEKFELLYSQTWSAPELRKKYDTEEAAQLALLVHLRWWARHDLDQVERLFKGSALCQSDWEEDAEKYGQLLSTAGELLGEDCYSASMEANHA